MPVISFKTLAQYRLSLDSFPFLVPDFVCGINTFEVDRQTDQFSLVLFV